MKKLITALAAIAILSACGSNTKPTPVMNAADYKTPNPEGMQKVHDAVTACHYYFIATTDGDQPDVRPFSSFNIHDGNLYILTGHNKNVGEQIDANPKVAICAMGERGVIRIKATLVEDTRAEVQEAVIAQNPRFAPMYSPGDGNTAVYMVTNATATIGGETIKF